MEGNSQFSKLRSGEVTSSCPRREFSEKRYGGRSVILWPSQDAPVEKEKREESAGTGLCVDAPADQNMEAEDEKNMEELSFVPSAVSEPRWAPQMCDNECRTELFKFFEVAAL